MNIIDIPEIEVYGGLSENHQSTNLEIINNKNFQIKGNQHFDNIINSISSLHFSGGTSRARYYQLRGLGELSQFSGEGAPHYYIGYIIDNIDFSGIGMVGNLFDIQQIEIFKGPQSSSFGTNAMGGTINIKSLDPKLYREYSFNTSIYSYNGNTLNFSTSQPINEKVLSRFTISKNYTNGYIKNLSDINNPKYDTNSKNEFLFRNKFLLLPNNSTNILITTYYIDFNNNYDMWTPDNNGFTTYSDFQGKDKHKNKSLSINANFKLNKNILIYRTSYSDNDIYYSYDGDWGNLSYWDSEYGYNENNADYFGPYYFIDITNRKRYKSSHELQFKSPIKNNIHLISGLFYSNTKEIDNRDGWLFAGEAFNINSTFNIENYAIYSKVEYKFSLKLILSAILRLDINNTKQKLNYSSCLDYDCIQIGNYFYYTEIEDDDLIGGNIKISYDYSKKLKLNFFVSRGYKTSGINQSQYSGFDENYRIYNTEVSNNIELGLQYNKKYSLSLFYMHRDNPHLRLSHQYDQLNPLSFDYATYNGNFAYHYGLELKTNNTFNNLNLNQSLSYLNTYISTFMYRDLSYGNREIAHAPKYKYNLNLEYLIKENLSFNIETIYVSSFYFEEQNNERSNSYNLINASIEYSYKNIQISIWSKNLTNQKYAIRGYKFLLDPSYTIRSYQSFGEPKTAGITLNFKI